MTTGTASRRTRPGWLHPSVVAAALLSVMAGYAQFSITAIAGDVAAEFGTPGAGEDLSTRIGLSATTLGIGLAIIRAASAFSLPAAAVADRLGRRRVLLWATAIGLAASAAGAVAVTFWMWVALVSFARPWLSTTNAVAGVIAAEEVRSKDRAWAIALIAAAYAAGAGIAPALRAVFDEPSFRLILGLTAVPLVLVPLVGRGVREPRIYADEHETAAVAPGLPGSVPSEHRPRLALLAGMFGMIALATGPGFTYLFVYGEQILGRSEGEMFLLVVGAGVFGATGLLVGRFAADRLGRRPTAAAGMAVTAIGVAVTYQGSYVLLATGYLLAVTASAAFGPAAGALLAEVFPTRMRSTAAGWAAFAGVAGAVTGLAAFGALADTFGTFELAIVVLAVPVGLSAVGFVAVPETRGRELDEPT